jgi:hypothetical protein
MQKKKQGHILYLEIYFWDSSISTIEDAISTKLIAKKFTCFVLILETVLVSSMSSTSWFHCSYSKLFGYEEPLKALRIDN